MSVGIEHTGVGHDEGLLLPGLDGTNPLGFLAALGLFRVIDTNTTPGQSAMRWVPSGTTWTPSIVGTTIAQSDLIEFLTERLVTTINEHPVRVLEALSSIEDEARPEWFQEHSKDISAKHRNRTDWVSAVASDAAPSNATNQIQTVRRDYYFGNLKSVIETTTPDHLEPAIFRPWNYADPLDNQSLHLDPSEDRRHALQWNRPSGDPDKKKSGGMLGANRLSIEAIPLFTSVPRGEALQTVGFTGQRSRDTRWTWPIWETALTLPVVQSLLTSRELQAESIERNARDMLRHQGVTAAYRTRRILVGKTPNFTPAQRIA